MIPELKTTCIYLTRKCPRKCDYCRIRNSNLQSPELTAEQWADAFKILESIGIEFNLLLGNEPLMLGEELPKILGSITTPYAIYTTAPEPLFTNAKPFLATLPNFSVPLDVTEEYCEGADESGDIVEKSLKGWDALQWAKSANIPDVHGMLTISKLNYKNVADIVEKTINEGIFIGLNIIHWDKDGKYDFFPPKEEISDYVLTDEEFQWFCDNQIPKLKELFKQGKIQNPPEYFDLLVQHGQHLSWHCKYPILTIDADGSLRLCGYRKGEQVAKWSVFDLNIRTIFAFITDWLKDSANCPGCAWSYPILNETILANKISTYDGFVERDKGVEQLNGRG